MSRDTSREGLVNRIEFYLLTHFKPVWQFIQKTPFLERWMNAFLIDRAVKKVRNRPHPFSLRSDYTSWSSLTERQYSGRHLSPAEEGDFTYLPSAEEVAQAFLHRGSSPIASHSSSLLLSHFAQWFIDGFLRTSRCDYRQNTSNHEIDLCTVYGLTPEISWALRVHEGGRLKSQTLFGGEFPPYYHDEHGQPKPEFEEAVPLWYRDDLSEEKKKKLFAMGVERANVQIGFVMMNTLCLREHNRLCKLMQTRYPDWDDERLFQTARNTLIALILKIVIEDYINHLAPYHFRFKAIPQSFYQKPWYRPNWMTVEFSLLYRWHGLVASEVKVGDTHYPAKETLFHNQLLIERGLSGAFDDASHIPAGKIGLGNTQAFLIDTEQKSIELGRRARLKPYNAYREHCGYPKVTDFDQITGDAKRQALLKDLYQHVDNIEFYTGLFAEDDRPNSPLSPLIGRLVGVDAFSQALTNPLLSEHVYNKKTFSSVGWEALAQTHSLGDLVQRNIPGEAQQSPLVSFDAPPPSTEA